MRRQCIIRAIGHYDAPKSMFLYLTEEIPKLSPQRDGALIEDVLRGRRLYLQRGIEVTI
jgi:hypothetical protein